MLLRFDDYIITYEVMSSASTLTEPEIRLIKAMLALTPRPSNQIILAHFSRPGRDLNHRVIAEIKNGSRRPEVTPASRMEALNFMLASRLAFSLDPSLFVESDTLAWLRLVYWPVGQGLFSTGAVLRRRSPPLTWVYDCGTASRDKLLTTALNAYCDLGLTIGQDAIRLAVLSHFDKDHISGIVRLSKARPIQTLMLPYIPLWLRIAIAVEENVDLGDPLFAFFVDPVSYLLRAGGEIGEILFVPSSDPEDAPLDTPGGPDFPPDEGDDTLKIDYGDPPAEDSKDPILFAGTASRVRFLRRSGRIAMPLLWEFVPYNDAGLADRATPDFARTVAPLVTQFTEPSGGTNIILKKLKALYDVQFGSSSKNRNMISLFMYSGPLGARARLTQLRTSRPVDEPRLLDGFSQMYTGDGYLNSGPRLDAFCRFFRPERRLERCGLLQVMHHGSESNWYQGVAVALKPAVSLFSSDPAHMGYRHPDAVVLRDFWSFHPVQVDGDNHFCLSAGLSYRP